MTRTATTDSGLHVGELVFARELPHGASILECLRTAWDEAQWEARRTYDKWHRSGDADGGARTVSGSDSILKPVPAA